MPDGLIVDASLYERKINRLYQMGTVRRRDISKVFSDADKSLISLAKANVAMSKRGVSDKLYASRTHKRGNLRRGIGFAVSKKYRLVYFVRPKAWYRHIYSTGHHSYMGNPFMERAFFIKQNTVMRSIERGMKRLIERTWNGTN